MKLQISTISKSLFTGEAQVVSLPTQAGEVSILDHHTPMTTLLEKGVIHGTDSRGQKITYAIESGFLEVSPDNQVIVLVTGAR